jgi:hypothetical protein
MSARHIACIAAVALAGATAHALGDDAATPPPAPKTVELVPRAKLVKAVRARDAANARALHLARQNRELRALTTLTPESNRELGRRLAAERGWTGAEWTALDGLWQRESGWRAYALNGSSGACHIPQALPCSKIPGGLRATPAVAIRWGLDYIGGRYGRPSAAKAHSNANNWY